MIQCPSIPIGSSPAASSWTSSIYRARPPFVVPPARVVVVPRVDALCMKGRRCMRCASWGSITSPKGSQHQTLACCPCRLHPPVPDATIRKGQKLENDPLSHGSGDAAANAVDGGSVGESRLFSY